jgi:hypothetical protein
VSVCEELKKHRHSFGEQPREGKIHLVSWEELSKLKNKD